MEPKPVNENELAASVVEKDSATETLVVIEGINGSDPVFWVISGIVLFNVAQPKVYDITILNLHGSKQELPLYVTCNQLEAITSIDEAFETMEKYGVYKANYKAYVDSGCIGLQAFINMKDPKFGRLLVYFLYAHPKYRKGIIGDKEMAKLAGSLTPELIKKIVELMRVDYAVGLAFDVPTKLLRRMF
jgi:hypothetical protein